MGDEYDVQLIAYDAAGEVIASIALWVDSGDRIWIDSDYEDGFAEVMIVDGRATLDSTLAPETLTKRTRLIMSYVEPGGPQAAKPMGCALFAAGAVITCSFAQPGCPIAAGVAACHCLPLVVQEWEGYSCF